jgi:hypothetical protein
VFSGTIEEEPKPLSSELPAGGKLYMCETVSKLEQEPSCISEGKTKEWFTEEYPNLVNKFSVRTFQNSVSEETMLKVQNECEDGTQDCADASVTNKHIDADWHGPSGSLSKTVYCNELKPDTDEILPSKVTSFPEDCRIQPVTVKFLINKTRAFTCAFGMHTCIGEVKKILSRTFRCPSVDLQLVNYGVALSDSFEISELGVEPYGTVEIEIKAKGSLKTENIYDVPVVPDVITVRVESGTQI